MGYPTSNSYIRFRSYSKDVQSQLYYIDYQIESSEDKVTIATTRPETMMGDTAIAVNPKIKDIKFGGKAIIPIVNRTITIISDHYADPDQGVVLL